MQLPENMGAERAVTRDVACLVLTLLLSEGAMKVARLGFSPRHREEIKTKIQSKASWQV